MGLASSTELSAGAIKRVGSGDWLPAIFIAFLVANIALILPVWFDMTIGQVDTSTHLRWAQQFDSGIRDGHVYPRWAFASNGGLGDPTFLYYQPLLYYTVSLLNVFFDDVALALKATLLVSNAIFGLATYSVLRAHASTLHALYGMAFLQFTPLLFFLQAYYGAYPTVFAAPFALLFVVESIRSNIRSRWCALWLAFTVLSHILSAFMVLVAVGFFLISRLLVRREPQDLRGAVNWTYGVLLGLVIAAVYLLPALTQLDLVSPRGWVGEDTLDWRRAFAFPTVTYSLYGFRWFILQYPFPFLALITLGVTFWVSRRVGGFDRSSCVPACCGVATVALLLSSEVSYPLYAGLPALEMIQWPYRFVFPATIVVALALMVLINRDLQGTLNRVVVLGVVLSTVALMGVLQFKLYHEGQSMPDITSVMKGRFGQPEYRVRDTGPAWRAYLDSGGFANECEIKGAICTELVKRSHEWTASVMLESDAVIRVPVFTFPAWVVSLNGRELERVEHDPETGLILVSGTEGVNLIRITWKRLPVESWAALISALGVLGLALPSQAFSWRRVGKL